MSPKIFKVYSNVIFMVEANTEDDAIDMVEDRLVEMDLKMGMFDDWDTPFIMGEYSE